MVIVILILAHVELVRLDLQVAATKAQSVKDSTKKNLLSQLGSSERFCDRYILEYFPCDNRQLCRYRQYLSKTFQSPDAVGNYLSGVRICLALLGLEVPDTNDR